MKNIFVKFTGILALTCGISVAFVAGANEVTKGIIAAKQEADVKAAYRDVLPQLGDLTKEKSPGGLIGNACAI